MRWLIELCLRQRFVVIAGAAILVALGANVARDAPFDVFPEFAPPRVEIQTEAPGLSSPEVEALVTTPIEAGLAGMPGVTAMRSKSVLGLSSVLLLLEPGADLAPARALVQERMSRLTAQLPSVARPPVMLSPLSSTSRILKIGMWGSELSQMELTDLARWVVRPRLMSIPGVANVAIWGERDRQLQVRIDPDRLHAHGIPLDRVLVATRDAVAPRTGGFVDGPTQRLPVIQAPPARTASELGRIPISTVVPDALPLSDVAEIVEDHPPPIGDAVVTRGAGLLLIIEKHPDGNTLEITDAVDAALHELAPAMRGVETDATIFRPASFIERALGNLAEALGIGCVLVIVILLLFLWDWRTALISVIAIPISLLAAAAVLTLAGETLNTMVIAGLILALGEVVDDAIIDVENIHRRLRAEPEAPSAVRTIAIVLDASLEVRSAVVYASLIVGLVFVPVLFLGGVAGEFFRPLAIAYELAVAASTIVALTITPALALVLLPKAARRRAHGSPIARVLSRHYEPLIRRLLPHPFAGIGVLAGVTALSVGLFVGFGEEFLPQFQENDFLMHWVAKPGTSLEAVRRTAERARDELMEVEGVRNFGAHIGRAEVADEVVGPNFAELWISVDPEADQPATLARVREVVDGYPGLYRDVQTYLQERMREVVSGGGGGSIVVRIFGPELTTLRERAHAIAERLSSIDGIAHAAPEAQVDVPQIQVAPRLDDCTALGVDSGVVRQRVSVLLQGERVGQIVRDQQPIDVVVWGNEPARASLSSVRDLLIAIDDRRSVRLADVADVRIVPMPNTIAHDGGSRKIDVTVQLDEGADLGAVALAVENAVREVPLPRGHHTETLGEHEARSEARTRLIATSALALLGILLLLHSDFRSIRLSLLVFASLPFALAGGIVAVALTGGLVSLGTLVGLVTVIGIAARNGILLIAHYRQLEDDERVEFGTELLVRGASERLAPILMTALATGLALVPLIVRGGAPGYEIEHPMAVVIVGGLISSTVLNLFVMPILYGRFGRRSQEPE